MTAKNTKFIYKNIMSSADLIAQIALLRRLCAETIGDDIHLFFAGLADGVSSELASSERDDIQSPEDLATKDIDQGDAARLAQ